MKNTLLILFVVPVFCFAQHNENTVKPVTDACPTWNKKTNNSKAEYFYYLRTNKSKDKQIVSNYPTSSQRTYPSKANVRYTNPEEDPFLVPKRARRTPKTSSPVADNILNAAGTINAGYTREEKTEPKPEHIKIQTKKEVEPEEITTQAKREPVIDPIENKEEKATGIKEAAAMPGEKPLSKRKLKKEKRFKRRSNTTSRHKTKACKSGNASKCPSF